MNAAWAIGFAIVNVVSFFVCVWDKQRAKTGEPRIPERVLWLFAVCFGALGIYAGMRIYHHKTQKSRFVYGVPLLFIAQLFAMIYVGVFAV